MSFFLINDIRLNLPMGWVPFQLLYLGPFSNVRCISRFMLSEIADDKWTVAIILRGLKQGRDFKKYNDRSVESEMAWEEMENLCIIRVVEDENGKQSREIVEIEKDEVYF